MRPKIRRLAADLAPVLEQSGLPQARTRNAGDIAFSPAPVMSEARSSRLANRITASRRSVAFQIISYRRTNGSIRRDAARSLHAGVGQRSGRDRPEAAGQ